MENERLDHSHGVWLSGAGGVDIFFVISGFVMVLSSRSLQVCAKPARVFLQRRIERVVPMYWLITTAKLMLAVLLPAAVPHLTNGAWHIVASYLFLPSLNAAGAIHPVLIVGWTLNYEAAFYVLVAMGLGLRLRLPPYLPVVLPVISLAGWSLRGRMPVVFSQIDPLMLEFAYGTLLAGMLPWLHARTLWARLLCWTMLLAGFVVIGCTPFEVVRSDRPFVWGLAGMIVVGSAVALEDSMRDWTPKWMLAIGDASYSNYLVHTIVLAGLGTLWARLGNLGRWQWSVGTLLYVVVCTIAAGFVYRFVERPITRWLRERRVSRVAYP